eukprot:scaffold126178_cov21-Tisochrysis_lutea.AAC.1
MDAQIAVKSRKVHECAPLQPRPECLSFHDQLIRSPVCCCVRVEALWIKPCLLVTNGHLQNLDGVARLSGGSGRL